MEVETSAPRTPMNGLTLHHGSQFLQENGESHNHDTTLDERADQFTMKTLIEVSSPDPSTESEDINPACVPDLTINHIDNGIISDSSSDDTKTEIYKPKRPPPPPSSGERLKQLVTELENSNRELENRLTAVTTAAQRDTQQLENIETERRNIEIEKQKLLSENSQLQQNVAAQQDEIKLWRERIDANDKAARKAIEKRALDYQAKFDQCASRLTECQAEKESMVVKFALGETKISTLNSNASNLETRLRERDREKASLSDKIKALKSENIQTVLASQANKNAAEVQALQKEGEKLKEELSTLTVRTKWAQNKLTAEKNAHKDTKSNLDRVQRKLLESKEECEQVRANCQRMIETYQKSEEIASSRLGVELQQKSNEFNKQTEQVSCLNQKLSEAQRDVEKLSGELQVITKQRFAATDKISELEDSLISTGERLVEEQQLVTCLRGENSDARSRLSELSTITKELEGRRNEVEAFSAHIEAQEAAWHERDAVMDGLRNREADSLQLTQRMTMRNAELQSECSKLNGHIEELTQILKSLEQTSEMDQEMWTRERQNHNVVATSLRNEIGRLSAQLVDSTTRNAWLRTEYEAANTEINSLRKKQTSSLKELKREVHTLRRQLEAHESKHEAEDQTPREVGGREAAGRDELQRDYRARPVDLHDMAPPAFPVDIPEDCLEPSFLEPDKQKLIEKIVSLQRKNARKNEKIDFCEDQIRSLIEEVQKKNKIIQNYALREEAGALSSDSRDQHRFNMAKKRGIMASISNQQALDGAMNLELSLQINHRLQAVLEDTLLKNITLKENMETLGKEIARMAAENADPKHKLASPS